MGRIEIFQKNLDTILQSFAILAKKRADIEFHFYGGGPDGYNDYPTLAG